MRILVVLMLLKSLVNIKFHTITYEIKSEGKSNQNSNNWIYNEE